MCPSRLLFSFACRPKLGLLPVALFPSHFRHRDAVPAGHTVLVPVLGIVALARWVPKAPRLQHLPCQRGSRAAFAFEGSTSPRACPCICMLACCEFVWLRCFVACA